MALTKLAKRGYGQLELNFAAFRRSGDIEAKCKIADGIAFIENGMLLAVDRRTYTVGYPTGAEGEVIALNYTTEHMYDERRKALKDFKLDANTFYPRLGYIGKPDKFTTNTVVYDTDEYANLEAIATAVKEGRVYGKPCVAADVNGENVKGYIQLTAAPEGAVVEVQEVTTMPDGQDAIKFAGL